MTLVMLRSGEAAATAGELPPARAEVTRAAAATADWTGLRKERLGSPEMWWLRWETEKGGGQPGCPAPSEGERRQETFSAVSSTTKLVWSDESSVMVKRIVTVLPLYAVRACENWV